MLGLMLNDGAALFTSEGTDEKEGPTDGDVEG